jgi:site-specific DNA-cytosine methylase
MPDGYTEYGTFVKDPDYDKQWDIVHTTKQISNSRRYKMIGNGWTVDVIKHILNGIPEQSLGTVVSLFDGCGCGYQALKGVKR